MRSLPVQPRSTPYAIGSKLRAARQNMQMTIEQLAEITELSKGFISKVERDQTSPSVATLLAICDVLNVDVGILFAHTETGIIALADAPKINLGGENVRETLISPRTEGRIQVVRSHVDTGREASGGPDLYTVNTDVDMLHVLSGDVELQFSDTAFTLKAGDSITFDGRAPHTWRTLTDAGADLIWIMSPAAWTGVSPE